MSLATIISKETGIDSEDVKKVSDALLRNLHKTLAEYDSNGDYIGEQAHWDLSERSFYHLLGFLEQFSDRYSWEKGSVSQYLGRLPPVDRWKQLSKETAGWNFKK